MEERTLELEARHRAVAAPGGIFLLIASLLFWIFFAGGAIFPPAAIAGPVPAAIAALVWMAPILLGPLLGGTSAKVRIGRDGVFVRSLGTTRFIAFRELDELFVTKERFQLRLRTGRLYPLQLVERSGRHLKPVDHTKHHAAETIRAGIAAARLEREASREESELARGAKSDAAWLSTIDGQARDDEAYRDAPLDRAALAKLSTDPHAEPSVRAASALVLRRAGLRAAEKSRLAEAAKGTAHPQVRVALEAAADEEVHEVEVAKAVARVR
jgi:hypothetical protein